MRSPRPPFLRRPGAAPPARILCLPIPPVPHGRRLGTAPPKTAPGRAGDGPDGLPVPGGCQAYPLAAYPGPSPSRAEGLPVLPGAHPEGPKPPKPRRNADLGTSRASPAVFVNRRCFTGRSGRSAPFPSHAPGGPGPGPGGEGRLRPAGAPGGGRGACRSVRTPAPGRSRLRFVQRLSDGPTWSRAAGPGVPTRSRAPLPQPAAVFPTWSRADAPGHPTWFRAPSPLGSCRIPPPGPWAGPTRSRAEGPRIPTPFRAGPRPGLRPARERSGRFGRIPPADRNIW